MKCFERNCLSLALPSVWHPLFRSPEARQISFSARCLVWGVYHGAFESENRLLDCTLKKKKWELLFQTSF